MFSDKIEVGFKDRINVPITDEEWERIKPSIAEIRSRQVVLDLIRDIIGAERFEAIAKAMRQGYFVRLEAPCGIGVLLP